MKTILLILLILIVLYLFLICPSLRKIDRKPFTGRYYAHRGLHDNKSDAPENSLPAFRKAVEAGYGIELDIQLTKDDVMVVCHDMNLVRMYKDEEGKPVEGKIRDYTYEEIMRFHILDTEERMPKFTEVLEVVNGKVPLIVELKAESGDKELQVCAKSFEILKDYKGVYCVESFHPGVVYWYKKNHPEIIRGQLSEDYHKDDPSKSSFLFFALTNLLMNFLTKPDFIAYNHHHESNLSRRLCRYLYHNLSVAYTVKSQEELDRNEDRFDILIFDSFIPRDKG